MSASVGSADEQKLAENVNPVDRERDAGCEWWRLGWQRFELGAELFRKGWGYKWTAAERWKNMLLQTDGDVWAAQQLLAGWWKAWEWKTEAEHRPQRVA